jgi:hypothetical protein
MGKFRRFFYGNLRNYSHHSYTTKEDGLLVWSVPDFALENYTGMYAYIEGLIRGTYNPPSKKTGRYSIINPCRKNQEWSSVFPDKFCTDWFFDIANRIPQVDIELSSIASVLEGGGGGSAGGGVGVAGFEEESRE